MIGDALSIAYPWIKSFHVISVIAWMAGIFYLPRLFVHHAEKVETSSGTDALFQMMESKLLKVIMNPAMLSTWFFGTLLAVTPGVIDWSAIWPWTKLASVLAMTWFHIWLEMRLKEFKESRNTRSGRTYRIMNEVPTVLMIIIVISVIARPF